MIMKLLLIIAVVGIIYFFFIKKKPIQRDKEESTKKKPEANDLVECATCGVYSDIGESLLSNGKYYCSKECLQKVS